MRRSPFLPLALLLLSFLSACSSRELPAPPPAADAAATPAAAAPPLPAGLEPVSAHGGGASADAAAPAETAAASAGGAEISAPGLAFSLPAGWVSEPPSSSMRLAQALVPGPGGDGALTVFYFGPGGGGGVEANLERWAGQVEATSAPERESFAVGPLQVTWIAVAGTLKPSSMGTGPATPQPDSVLLGAVVEGPEGPWFFKATGPAATMAAAREPFLAMLRAARPAP